MNHKMEEWFRYVVLYLSTSLSPFAFILLPLSAKAATSLADSLCVFLETQDQRGRKILLAKSRAQQEEEEEEEEEEYHQDPITPTPWKTEQDKPSSSAQS
jgi:hypothetical protein